LLDIVFLSSGFVQVNQVVSGLGHGLDEAAVRAAQQIRLNRKARRAAGRFSSPCANRVPLGILTAVKTTRNFRTVQSPVKRPLRN
jgi:hypothetical protein